MKLKELRKNKGLTQKEAAKLIGIPFRTYQNYEYGESKSDSFLGRSIAKTLNEYEPYTETRGIYKREVLLEKCKKVMKGFDVDCAVLYGDYGKGKAKEDSEIAIMIIGKVNGLLFFSLRKKLADATHKKINLVKLDDLMKDKDSLTSIFKTGTKIL